MKFLFTCGGTAGHINPAIALAGEIRRIMPDAEILFIGSGRQLENRLVPLAGFEIKNIKVSGFERSISLRSIFENIGAVKNLLVADVQMGKILKNFRPDAAIGTGGYVCYPVLKKAARQGIPTVIHESNAIPGLTTRLLCDKVDKVLVGFPDVKDRYKHPEKVIVTGTPVRGDFSITTKEEARKRLGIIDSRPLVVSFWGSLGAKKMNEVMEDFIKLDAESGSFHLIHATGSDSDGVGAMAGRLKAKGLSDEDLRWIDLRPYIDNMPLVMAAADIVMCRAGASTISEITMMGKPAVLVPSPFVANNHQEKNAEQLAHAGGAVVIHDQECTGRLLYDTVQGLVGDERRLRQMSDSLKTLAYPDATSEIVDLILSMC